MFFSLPKNVPKMIWNIVMFFDLFFVRINETEYIYFFVAKSVKRMVNLINPKTLGKHIDFLQFFVEKCFERTKYMHLIFQYDKCNIWSSRRLDINVEYLLEFLSYKMKSIMNIF